MDNPKTRSGTTCPLCYGEKERGLVVCWQCSTSSNPLKERFIEMFEAVLALERPTKH
jgi:hypothetical protein